MLSLILTGLIESAGTAIRRSLLRHRLLLVALGISVIAMGFLALAWDIWLMKYLGAAGAAAVTALILLVLALSLVVIAGQIGRSTSVPRPTAAALIEAVRTDLGASAQPLTLAALVAGFMVAYAISRKRNHKDKA